MPIAAVDHHDDLAAAPNEITSHAEVRLRLYVDSEANPAMVQFFSDSKFGSRVATELAFHAHTDDVTGGLRSL